jgi:acetylglutamate kinase
VPVIAPLARDEQGLVCNVNADDAAAGIAADLGARQFVLLTDVDGVRGPDGQRLATIAPDEAEVLISDGTIGGGMVPKVRAALGALSSPDAEAVIADGSVPGALRRAVEDRTFGTRVTSARAVAA